MVNTEQNMNICNQNTCNPYLCASVPDSNLVIPQGQIKVPDNIQTAPQAMPVVQVQPSPAVSYNQITPYINTNSKIFNPYIKTRSGETVHMVSETSSPYNYEEAQVVYEGPVKSINPQITPEEQIDNKINKDYEDYFKKKTKYNKELKDTLDTLSRDEEKKSFKGTLKLIGAIALMTVAYTYRKKIPGLKKFFK